MIPPIFEKKLVCNNGMEVSHKLILRVDMYEMHWKLKTYSKTRKQQIQSQQFTYGLRSGTKIFARFHDIQVQMSLASLSQLSNSESSRGNLRRSWPNQIDPFSAWEAMQQQPPQAHVQSLVSRLKWYWYWLMSEIICLKGFDNYASLFYVVVSRCISLKNEEVQHAFIWDWTRYRNIRQ